MDGVGEYGAGLIHRQREGYPGEAVYLTIK
jgi:hypothetical protein